MGNVVWEPVSPDLESQWDSVSQPGVWTLFRSLEFELSGGGGADVRDVVIQTREFHP